MRTHVRETLPLGDLIVSAFDMAAGYSTDAREIACLATGTVGRMLRLLERPAPALFTTTTLMTSSSTRGMRH